jgi:hypothetical protein
VAEATKPAKRARKLKAGLKSIDSTNGTIAARVRKPRKPIKKSESIILNSDEPDDVVNAVAEKVTIACEDSGIFIEAAELPTHNAHEQNAQEGFPRQNREVVFEQVNTTLTSDVTCDEVSIRFQKQLRARKSLSVSPEASHNKAEAAGSVQIEPAADAPEKLTQAEASCSGERSRSLSATIEGLRYSADSCDVAAAPRTETGESMAKRRRIDLGDEDAMEHSVAQPNEESNLEMLAEAKPSKSARKARTDKPTKSAKAPAVPKVKKAKAEKAPRVPKSPKPPKTPKPKKPKTKARTITDLVTSAFKPAAEAALEPLTVSAFFTPCQETAKPEASVVLETASDSGPAKAKKPREPRAKIIDPHQTTTRTLPKVATAARTKKRKPTVKFNEDDHVPELLVPEMARALEKSQGFLFGTSSQLAAEESPTFIRDMQLAIEQSEASLPLAPHTSRTGTLLERIREASHSPQKTRSGLWREAARDREGGLQTCGRRRRVKGSFEPRPLESVTKPDERQATIPTVQLPVPGLQFDASRGTAIEPGPVLPEVSVQADDDAGNPDVGRDGQELGRDVTDEAELPDISKSDAPAAESAFPVHQPSSPMPDDWMLLSSDTTVEEEVAPAREMGSARRHETVEQSQPPVREQPTLYPPPQSTKERPVTGTPTVSALPRTPLQALDRNISPAKVATKEKGAKKQSSLTKAKDLDTARLSSVPVTKPRRRPRKDRAPTQERDGAAMSSSEVLPRLPTAASQPEKPKSSQWIAIDEISDSDTPTTPSPPRVRRAASSPPTIRPLPLSLPSSPAKSVIPILLHPILKIADAAWPAVRETLFPKITRLVKSTPPSTEMNLPTWHEKMLLYDPIVLEDFTAWLTEQGLKYKLRRPATKAKAKSAAKSRKKTADADTLEAEGDEVSAPEFDVVQEEIKPWMVQRWCEEKSVCCLWKEGLRGGVKVKY